MINLLETYILLSIIVIKYATSLPSTDTITEWTVPTNSSGPIGVAFDSSSANLYFAENNTNKIGRLVLSANTFTEWTVPTNSKLNDHSFQNIGFDPLSRDVYFAGHNSNKMTASLHLPILLLNGKYLQTQN